VLLLWIVLADIAAPPAPAKTKDGWAASCEQRLRRAAADYMANWHVSGDWFDLYWHFKKSKDSVEVHLDVPADICGVYDNYKLKLRRGEKPRWQRIEDYDHDFDRFKRAFQPAVAACLSQTQ